MDGLHVVVVDRFGCWLMMSIHKRCCCCCFVCFGELFLFLYMYACEKKKKCGLLGCASWGGHIFDGRKKKRGRERESNYVRARYSAK